MRHDDHGLSRRQALGLAALGGANLVLPGTAFGQAPKDVKILLSSASPNFAWAVSYAAGELGYYKDEGLNIERIPNNTGPGALTALVAGAGHVDLSTPGELLVAVTRGQKMKILMALSNYSSLYLSLSKEYAEKVGISENMPLAQKQEAAKKFKGIKIGITSPGSQTDVTTRLILKNAGLDPAVDAELIPLGSTQNSLAAMGKGSIDGFMSSAPIPEFAAAQLGAVNAISVAKDEVPGLKEAVGHATLARAVDVEQQPDLFAALIRADVRALRYIVENPKEASDVVYRARYNSIIKPDLWPTVWDNNRSQFRTPYVTPKSVEAWVTMGLLPGVTDPKAVDAANVVDMRFVDQAVKKLGWTVPA